MVKTNRKNGIQLIMMIILTCMAQVLALYKSSFTATNFGATEVMDAYNYATTVAQFVFSFITAGITTVIIPAYVKKEKKEIVNSFITAIFSTVSLISIIIIIFRIPLIDLLLDRSNEFIKMASSYLLICFLIQGITTFLGVTAAYYQCINRYLIPKFILLFINLFVALVLILGFIEDMNTYLVLLLGSSTLNLIIDVSIALRVGFRYVPAFHFFAPETKKLFRIFVPVLFSSGVFKISSLVDSVIAGNLVDGQLTILTYATQVINIVNTFIIGNLTVYAYPKIVESCKQGDSKKQFWDYSILFQAIVCLLITGFFVIGKESVSFIFLGGKFTKNNIDVLYICVCIYIFGEQTNIVRDLIYRYFYANGNTKDTFKNSIFVSILNIVISIILVFFIGLYGIILGTVISGFFSLLSILIRFKKRYGIGVSVKFLLYEQLKISASMIITMTLLLLIKSKFIFTNLFVNIFVYGVATVVIYIFLLILFKSKCKNIKL